jgi:pimeloyl-ACP methyl ester carboxylesterase
MNPSLIPGVLQARFDTGSVQINYLRREGRGRTLLFVHGLGGSAETWLHQLRGLDPSLDCVAVDLPGFGRSSKPMDAPYGYTYFARAVGKLVDHLALDRPVLVGHSLGGGTVLRLAVQRPACPAGIVLIASGGLCHQFTFALRVLTLPGVGEALTRPSERGVRARFQEFIAPEDPLYEPFFEVALASARDRASQHAFLQTLRNNATVFSGTRRSIRPILEGLDRIRCPVLALWGDKDPVVRLSDARPNLERLPLRHLEVFAGLGHEPHFVEPDRANGLIQDFVSSLPS